MGDPAPSTIRMTRRKKMSGRDSTTAIETNHKGAVNPDNPAKEAAVRRVRISWRMASGFSQQKIQFNE
jgi:hypothetical protein